MLAPSLPDNIIQRYMPKTWSASSTTLTVPRTNTFHNLMNESCTRITFSVVNLMAAYMLLLTNLPDRFIQSVHAPAPERKVVPYHSPTVCITMVHKTHGTAMKSRPDIRQYNTENLNLLVIPIESDRSTIAVARNVVLKAKHETLLLLSRQAASLIEVFAHKTLAKTHAYMTDKRPSNIYS